VFILEISFEDTNYPYHMETDSYENLISQYNLSGNL